MKIAYLGRYLTRSIKTGIEVYAESLFQSLEAFDKSNQYLLLLPKKNSYKTTAMLHHYSPSGRLFGMTFGLINCFRKIDCDLFFNPGTFLPPYNPFKTIVTVHDVAWKRFPNEFPTQKRIAFDIMHKYVVNHATHLVAVSESTKKDLIEFFGVNENDVSVVYHGVDESYFTSEKTNETLALPPNLGLNQPYILFIGTMQRRKNIIRLVEAFSKLRDKSHLLVLAGGKGWFWDNIRKSIESSSAKERIRVLGYIDEKTKRALYKNAQIFIYPSLYEGFGLPVLEAMASKTPSITSKYSSTGEIAGDAAILVDPYSVDDMVDKMESLVNDTDLRNKLSQRGVVRARMFSWENTAKQMIEVFENCR